MKYKVFYDSTNDILVLITIGEYSDDIAFFYDGAHGYVVFMALIEEEKGLVPLGEL